MLSTIKIKPANFTRNTKNAYDTLSYLLRAKTPFTEKVVSWQSFQKTSPKVVNPLKLSSICGWETILPEYFIWARYLFPYGWYYVFHYNHSFFFNEAETSLRVQHHARFAYVLLPAICAKNKRVTCYRTLSIIGWDTARSSHQTDSTAWTICRGKTQGNSFDQAGAKQIAQLSSTELKVHGFWIVTWEITENAPRHQWVTHQKGRIREYTWAERIPDSSEKVTQCPIIHTSLFYPHTLYHLFFPFENV